MVQLVKEIDAKPEDLRLQVETDKERTDSNKLSSDFQEHASTHVCSTHITNTYKLNKHF